ncbi:hypothetical protein Tco_0109257 [Tanacetum coccineum]
MQKEMQGNSQEYKVPRSMTSQEVQSSYARAMIELQADADLKDTIIVVALKLIGEGFSMCNVSNSNPFNALNMVENDADLCTNEENSKLAEKGDNSDVVSSAHGTSSKAFGSPTTTPLAERINDVERKMLNERLVLVDDDGKPLKKVGDPVNADSDHKVDKVFNETTIFRSLTSFNVDNNSKSSSGVANKSLYKQMR